jgi:hypothetical protein
MPARRIVVGLVAVTFGLAVFLDRLGGIDRAITVLRQWWPMLLIAFGLASIVRLVHRPWGVIGPLIVISAGILFLLITFRVLDRDAYPLVWPAGIALAGYSIVLSGADWSGRRLTEENEIRQFVWLRGKRIKSRATEFWRADITVLFGSVELDLRQATLYRRAVVNVNAVFGSVDVIVAPGISVHKRRPFILSVSGVQAGAPPADLNKGRLTINLLALFGTATATEATVKESEEQGAST